MDIGLQEYVICRVRQLENIIINTSAVDGKTIATGKGTHKHVSRDAAAEQALAILKSEDP